MQDCRQFDSWLELATISPCRMNGEGASLEGSCPVNLIYVAYDFTRGGPSELESTILLCGLEYQPVEIDVRFLFITIVFILIMKVVILAWFVFVFPLL